MKGKLLHLNTCITNGEAQIPGGLFGFWRQPIPHMSLLLWLFFQTTELLFLNKDQNNKRLCNRFRLLANLIH